MYATYGAGPFAGNTWNPETNYSPRNDTDKKSVATALYCIANARDTKIRRDSKNFAIQALIESGMQIWVPNSPKRISPKLLQQVFWRTANRMKPLDFEIFGQGRPEINRRLVTAGVSTVMDKGGYTKSLRDKGGAFQKLIMWGDGFVHFGANPDPKAAFPIIYTPVSNSNIYTDSYSTAIRAGGVGRAARQMAIIFSMGWNTAIAKYPKLKKIAALGKIPRDQGFLKELERTYIQTNKEFDQIEICYFYDLDLPGYVAFAGPTCAVLEELKGDKYPFTLGKKKEPYIPVLQFMCMPSTEGIYNHGLGDMFFDIAILMQELQNMGVNHAADNIDPFTLMSVPKGETAKLFNSMRAAGEMRAAGKRPVIPMEYDPASPGGGKIGMAALTTQNMINELQVMTDMLTREVSRMGINLDDVQYGPDVTAHQIVAEQQSQNSFVQQIQEYNASETEFSVISAMDMIEKLVSSRDNTPLDFNNTFPTQGQDGQKLQINADNVTLGAVRDELHKYYYWVDVNARTGIQPSGLLEQARLEKMIPLAPPGSKAQMKLLEGLSQSGSVDLSAEDFGPPQPPGPPPGGAPGGAPGGGQPAPGGPPSDATQAGATPSLPALPQPAMA